MNVYNFYHFLGAKQDKMKIEIDEDIIEFLKTIYFGNLSDPLKAASNRAYRDMNRTIRFNSLQSTERRKLRECTTTKFSEEIDYLCSCAVKSQDDYDSWHYNVCKSIIKTYAKSDVKLTYGQAQKWVNMTIKYLYILEAYTFDDVFEYLHIPIDRYILDIVHDELGIESPKVVWSKWDDYDKEYLDYQKKIRNKIIGCEPLRWEFSNWLKRRFFSSEDK